MHLIKRMVYNRLASPQGVRAWPAASLSGLQQQPNVTTTTKKTPAMID